MTDEHPLGSEGNHKLILIVPKHKYYFDISKILFNLSR